MNIVINQNDRGQAARAYAVYNFQGVFVIRVAAAGFNIEGFSDTFNDFRRAAHMTGGAITNTDNMPAAAFQVELGIKGDDPI